MKKYKNLELTVLSCFMQKPDLMKETVLNERYFLTYKRLWIFIKAFYDKFQTLDFNLMFTIVKDKNNFLNTMIELYDFELLPHNFKKYEQALIDAYNENEQDVKTIEQIYNLATQLYVRKIDLNEFKEQILKLLEQS